MGSKYSTTAISGYNAAPPPDDGSVTAANQLAWSKHINKIGDPLKTLAESINTKLVAFTDFGSRSTAVSDSTLTTDHMKTVEIASTATSGVTISLGDAVSMTAGYIVSVKNFSVHTQTIGRVTTADGIDGVTGNAFIAPKACWAFKVAATASNGYLTLSRTEEIAQNSQSTAYTTAWADRNGSILHPTADNNPRTFTIEANATIAYPIGTCIAFDNQINTLTIAITSDTLVLAGTTTTGSRTLAAGGLAVAMKESATVWKISGTGLS